MLCIAPLNYQENSKSITSRMASEKDNNDQHEVEVENMLVESGVMKQGMIPVHVYVSAEIWLSWGFAVLGLDWSSITIKVTKQSLSLLLELQASDINRYLSDMDLCRWFKDKKEQQTLILVQGSRTYFEHITQVSPRLLDEPLIYVCTDNNFLSGDTFRISHSEMGGVTNRSWSVYVCNIRFDAMNLKSNVRRSI